jgi:hypothetical protein
MKTTKKLLVWLLSLVTTGLLADNRIVLYVRHAQPDILKAAEQEAKRISLAEQVRKFELQTPQPYNGSMPPFSLNRYMTPSAGGIISLYAGYRNSATSDGLISFPLCHTSPKIYIAITPQVRLVNVMGNTYSHREYITEYINNQENPVQIYLFERKQDAKKLFYWDVQAVPVPADKVVNPITIVILAHPDNIYVKKEQSLATDNVQLTLPDIYLLSPIDPRINLQFMDIAYLFEPITIEQKKVADTTTQQMIMNI